MNRRTKLLLLTLAISVVFAAWQWFRPYDWSPDPAARFKVMHCMVERDHANLWLRIFLKPRDGQVMDWLKPVAITTAAGKQIQLADFDQRNSEGAAESASSTDPGPPPPADQLTLSFWLDESDLSGPIILRMNEGSLQIRSGDTLPQVADGGFRVFNTSGW